MRGAEEGYVVGEWGGDDGSQRQGRNTEPEQNPEIHAYALRA